MTLKNLLKERMEKERFRPSDIAQILGKKRQSVSYALNRDVNYITVKTLSQYVSAVGLRLNFAQLIDNKKVKNG